ncbi:GNAT family N-acetyltransferase [Lysinibacillus piscis]|uniref:N-acetyltransferase n=1 Tax=Lysinibacillus piscis TaxID=2518931 RepID=A0ABQ5NFP5_9BACI|nr:GNAT family N-acetyltransferase [Lysinibacillus sp. KH24]GLC87137.1 N-acetyltransferase [Lysinibacillus sp. KH24]
MEKIKAAMMSPSVRRLLAFATSEKNIEPAYKLYCQSPIQELYGYYMEGQLIGCIGIAFLDSGQYEIKHIAVCPNHRGKGLGGEMIRFIKVKYKATLIIAETDCDAVNFYRNVGFNIVSLGEKYPHVERFTCTLEGK